MSWDTSDLSSDTIYQDGTFGFLFTSSGNLYRGQAVRIIDDNNVTSSIVGSNGIGILDHQSYHGEECTVYLPGNIVYACSPESIIPGNFLYASSNGYVSEGRYGSERPMAISISTFETVSTNKVGKVLLI